MKWQKIETAPKDNAVVLLFSDDEGICTGYWIEAYGTYRMRAGVEDAINSQSDYWGTDYKDVSATHWMPLPEPPTED